MEERMSIFLIIIAVIMICLIVLIGGICAIAFIFGVIIGIVAWAFIVFDGNEKNAG
jgi:hypothetical protein